MRPTPTAVQGAGIALILVTGAIHFIDAPGSFGDATYKGVLFLVNGISRRANLGLGTRCTGRGRSARGLRDQPDGGAAAPCPGRLARAVRHPVAPGRGRLHRAVRALAPGSAARGIGRPPRAATGARFIRPVLVPERERCGHLGLVGRGPRLRWGKDRAASPAASLAGHPDAPRNPAPLLAYS